MSLVLTCAELYLNGFPLGFSLFFFDCNVLVGQSKHVKVM